MKKVILGILAIILLQIVYGYVIYFSVPIAERGAFGEMFGAMNTLFSGFALLAVIYTILIQQKDLEQKSKDIENISKALSRVTDAQENSVTAQKQQIEILHHTALLKAYSTMLAYFDTGIKEMKGFPVAEEYKKEREVYFKRLKNLLHTIEEIENGQN
jgi:hypothetical protein